MRKIMLAVATCAVFAFVPASALAKGHGRHSRHHAHHARVHHKKFGTDPSRQSTTTSPSSGQTAGTVQSFTGGVLTIALSNGTSVSGQVTADTEIKCVAPETSGPMGHDEGDGGGGSFGDHHGDHHGDQGGNDQGDNDPGDNDQDDQNQANPPCDMTSLVPGAVVQEAELNISGAGAVWEKVVLVTTPTSTAPSTTTAPSSGSSGG